jgi:hypothetical protein
MKIIAAAFFAFAVANIALPVEAVAQNCDHSYQTARDGSSCGGRAADQRRGGR